MKTIILLVVIIIIAYFGYEAIRIRGLIRVSSGMVQRAVPYQSGSGIQSILVIGDSTAVGVGSDAIEHSVAGRLGAFFEARVENHAVSGSVTADMEGQLKKAQAPHYDLIVIHTGANDIVQFHSLAAANTQLDALLKHAHTLSDRVVVITAGKVGEAPLFPQLFGWIWNWRARILRAHFIDTTSREGAVYIDLYNGPDPFSKDPAKYYGADTFHPSQYGYEVWFDQMKAGILARWPELAHE
ncbi:MAG: GDSL-like Lipase/Acylhydrolase family protein [Candidatus Kaiserbacteria bacterium]|nr:GDSL-like Lipase/Acylhydrolase family protein [Candidatus Kaiserbacteria bacterium]